MSEDERTNPLRDPKDRRLPRIAGPCALVMFGVTGDLAGKKLLPAVYDLANRGLLPPGFALVGFGRRDWSDEQFREVMHQAVKERARTPYRADVWEQLARGVRFVQGSFDNDLGFAALKQTLRELEESIGTGGNGSGTGTVTVRSHRLAEPGRTTVTGWVRCKGRAGHGGECVERITWEPSARMSRRWAISHSAASGAVMSSWNAVPPTSLATSTSLSPAAGTSTAMSREPPMGRTFLS